MDTISMIIGMGFLVLFTLPFLLIRISNVKKERLLIARFKQLSEKNNVVISEFDCWNKQYVIGMDTDKNAVCYLHVLEANEVFEKILLSDVKLVHSNRTYYTILNEELIDRLELAIELKSGGSANLEFYNRELSNGLSGEIKLLEKWQNKMN